MQRSIILGLGLGLSLVAGTLTACGGDSSSSAESYCARIQAFEDKSDSLDVLFDGDAAPSNDAMKDAFTTVQKMLADLKKGAPKEIESDVALVSGGIDDIVTVFEKYDWDIVALVESPDAAGLDAAFENAEMEAASDRLDAYSLKECGIKTES